MPRCEVIFYQEEDGTVPALDWLRAVGRRDRRIVQNLQAGIERLEEMGHELRRPEGDLLRDGVHELRARLVARTTASFTSSTAARRPSSRTDLQRMPRCRILRLSGRWRANGATSEIRRGIVMSRRSPMKRRTSSAVSILNQEFGSDPNYQAGLAEERTRLQAARAIYDARAAAGLTQQELARRVGTTQSVIARLEDADYEGHTFRMLNRIAAALDKKVEVRLVPVTLTPQAG